MTGELIPADDLNITGLFDQLRAPEPQPTEEQETPGFFESLYIGADAAWRQENTIASTMAAQQGPFERENPAGQRDLRALSANQIWREIPDEFLEFAGAYVDAETPEDIRRTTERLRREKKDRDTLAGIDGAASFALMFAAGLTDPINFVPVFGQAARSYKVGHSFVQGAARAGAVGAGTQVAVEGVLQATQEMRTIEQSAFAIGAATVFSGLVGGSAGAVRAMLGKAREDQIISRIGRDLGDEDPGPIPLNRDELDFDTNPNSVGAAATVTRAEDKLKAAFGIEKINKAFSPVLRGALSKSKTMRVATQMLVETPFYYTKNAAGVASDIAVETLVKMYDAPLASALKGMDEQFVRMRMGRDGGSMADLTRLATRDMFGSSGQMTRREFNIEVGKTMRRGDTHANPYVQRAAEIARKELFDPLKDRAIKVGLLPEDVHVTTALSYLTRVYNREKIIAQRPQWNRIVTDWVERTGDVVNRAEAKEIADQITAKIMGTPSGRTSYIETARLAGPLNERTFNIPDKFIEEYLESDVQTIARHYVHTMAPDIEMQARFGDVDMKAQLEDVRRDWDARIDAATSRKELEQLEKGKLSDLQDLEGMRDLMRGTYANPTTENGRLFQRVASGVKNLNYVRLLGGMTLSAIPDIARPVMVHGISRVIGDGLVPVMTNLRAMRAAKAEVRAAGTALDMTLNTRNMTIADIGDDFGRYSKFERGLKGAADKFGVISLMAPWNAAMKQLTGAVSQTSILRHAGEWGAGTLTPKRKEYMAMLGIDEQMAKRIDDQFQRHGQIDGGVRVPNTDAWTDGAARLTFRAALVKDVDRIIVTPGKADRPLWMNTTLGGLIGQFKSFGMSSAQRVLLAGLQQRDTAALNGALLMTFLGGLSTWAKLTAAGNEHMMPKTTEQWIKEGVDRSGLTGWLFDAHNILEKTTGVGLNNAMNGHQTTRYASRNAVGALLGPSFGMATDVGKTASALGGLLTGDGEVTQRDIHNFRKILPYQNLFYIRQLLDDAEVGIAKSLGLKTTKKRRR